MSAADKVVVSILTNLVGKDQVESALKGLGGSFGDLAETAGKSWKVIGGIALIGSLVSEYAKYEDSILKIVAVTSTAGQTATDVQARFTAFNDKALELGASTRYTATEAAEGMNFLAMAGLGVAGSLEAIGPALNLATAGNVSLADSANIVTNVLTGFGVPISQLTTVADSLTATFTGSNTSLQDLGATMSYVGPVASAAEIPLNDLLAAIGALGDSGIQADRAGTALRMSITRLVSPVRGAAEVLNNLGVETKFAGDSTEETPGKMRPFFDILEDLRAKGISTGQAMRLFGVEAGPSMLTLLATSDQSLKDFAKRLDDAGGRADEVRRIMDSGLGGALAMLGSALEALTLKLVVVFEPAITPVIKTITAFVTVVGDLVGAFGKLTEFALRPAIIAIEEVVRAFEGSVVGISNFLKAVTDLLTSGSIKGFEDFGAAILKAVDNFATFTGIDISDIGDAFVRVFGSMTRALIDLAMAPVAVVTAIADLATEITGLDFSAIGTAIVDDIASLPDTLSEAVSWFVDFASEVTGIDFSGFAEALIGTIASMPGIISEAMTALSNFAGSIADYLPPFSALLQILVNSGIAWGAYVAAVTAANAVMTLFAGGAAMATGAMGLVSTAAIAAAGAFRIFTAAMMANPIGAAAVIITGLATALFMIPSASEEADDGLKKIALTEKEAALAASRLANDYMEAVNAMKTSVKEAFEPVNDALKNLKQRAADLGSEEKRRAAEHENANKAVELGLSTMQKVYADAYSAVKKEIDDQLKAALDANEEIKGSDKTVADDRVRIFSELTTARLTVGQQHLTDQLGLIDKAADYEREKARIRGDDMNAIEIKILDEKRKVLEDIEKDYERHIDELNREANRHLDELRKIEDERLGFNRDVEDVIRDLRRTTMTDVEKYADKQKEIEETLSAARRAFAEGDFDLAKDLSEEAIKLSQSTARAVKDGDKEVVTQKQAVATAQGTINAAMAVFEGSINAQKGIVEGSLSATRSQMNQTQTAADTLAGKGRELGEAMQIRGQALLDDQAGPALDALQKQVAAATEKEAVLKMVADIEQASADVQRLISEYENSGDPIELKAAIVELADRMKEAKDYAEANAPTLGINVDAADAMGQLTNLQGYVDALKVAAEKKMNVAVDVTDNSDLAVDRITSSAGRAQQSLRDNPVSVPVIVDSAEAMAAIKADSELAASESAPVVNVAADTEAAADKIQTLADLTKDFYLPSIQMAVEVTGQNQVAALETNLQNLKTALAEATEEERLALAQQALYAESIDPLVTKIDELKLAKEQGMPVDEELRLAVEALSRARNWESQAADNAVAANNRRLAISQAIQDSSAQDSSAVGSLASSVGNLASASGAAASGLNAIPGAAAAAGGASAQAAPQVDEMAQAYGRAAEAERIALQRQQVFSSMIPPLVEKINQLKEAKAEGIPVDAALNEAINNLVRARMLEAQESDKAATAGQKRINLTAEMIEKTGNEEEAHKLLSEELGRLAGKREEEREKGAAQTKAIMDSADARAKERQAAEDAQSAMYNAMVERDAEVAKISASITERENEIKLLESSIDWKQRGSDQSESVKRAIDAEGEKMKEQQSELAKLIARFDGLASSKLGAGYAAMGLGRPSPFAIGGVVLPFATGGIVPGIGDSDTVRRDLDAGSFVLKKKAVQKYGSDFLKHLVQPIPDHSLSRSSKVKTILTPGEFVFTPNQTASIGLQNLYAMNQMRVPSPRQALAVGGIAGDFAEALAAAFVPQSAYVTTMRPARYADGGAVITGETLGTVVIEAPTGQKADVYASEKQAKQLIRALKSSRDRRE